MSSLRGLSYLVTGSTDGIGKHTASLLAARGATVLVHGRDRQRGEAALRDIERASDGRGELELYVRDLASLEEVRALAKDVSARHARLHGLINNAGVFETRPRQSRDGHELTFAVNVLAPYVLTGLLLGSAAAPRLDKVVNVSSISQTEGGGVIDFDNLQHEKGYDAHSAYGLSKLCMVCLTYSLADKLRDTPTTVNCLDPGTVNTKMLTAGWGSCGIDVEDATYEFDLATKEQFAGVSGEYFVYGQSRRSAPITYDAAVRQRLWERCAELTGLSY